jgi:hypothetical protein
MYYFIVLRCCLHSAEDIGVDWVDKSTEKIGHLSDKKVDIWAEHILLIICDLIQLVPLPSATFSHFKLILLPPGHQRGGGSRILSRIMFNLMKIKSLKVEVKCTKSA